MVLKTTVAEDLGHWIHVVEVFRPMDDVTARWLLRPRTLFVYVDIAGGLIITGSP